MPYPYRFPLVLISAILIRFGCAGAGEAAYTIAIKDHRFQPTEIEIPAGMKIPLTIKNLDPTPEEFESTELKREKMVPAGKEITIQIGPLKPGRYEFFGDFNPTTARGHIVVK